MQDDRNPLVSIIILNYNGLGYLKGCFDSLHNQKYKNIELILVDNNSQDGSVEFVRNNYNDVRIIQLDNNYGFAKANNIGASKSKGKYIVLLNNDTFVDENWINEMVKSAESSKNVGIVGSKIYYYDDKTLIDYAGARVDRYLKTGHFGSKQKDNELFSIPHETVYACGAALLVTRDLYKKIGLFDPAYFIYSEDLDLGIRAWIHGYRVIYSPQSFIFHKTNIVIEPQSIKKQFLIERNKLRTILKNYELKTLLYIIPTFLIKRLLVVLKLSLKLNKNAIQLLYIYIKSILWNIFNISSLIQNRAFIQNNRVKNDEYLFKIMEASIRFNLTIKNHLQTGNFTSLMKR